MGLRRALLTREQRQRWGRDRPCVRNLDSAEKVAQGSPTDLAPGRVTVRLAGGGKHLRVSVSLAQTGNGLPCACDFCTPTRTTRNRLLGNQTVRPATVLSAQNAIPDQARRGKDNPNST